MDPGASGLAFVEVPGLEQGAVAADPIQALGQLVRGGA
jgi:hypothetical protein